MKIEETVNCKLQSKCPLIKFIHFMKAVPSQITKWGRFMDPKWSRHKIKILFFWPLKWHERQPGPFWGQQNGGPLEKARFCARDHFESFNRPHFVIWQGCFDKPKQNLQPKFIGNFIPPVKLFFEAFFWFLVF